MSIKSVPLSVRISPEDAEFIAGLELDGAKTPSDKVRALIAAARRSAGTAGDYGNSLAASENLIGPSLRLLREAEYRHHCHSEFLIRIGEWLPEAVAFLRAAAPACLEPDGRDALFKLEDGMVRRVAGLSGTLLQAGLNEKSPGCYDGEVLNKHLQRVLELAELILATPTRNKENAP